MNLTRGQAEFVDAVRRGRGGMFHIAVTRPVEELGLVRWVGGWRSERLSHFPATDFIALSDRGTRL